MTTVTDIENMREAAQAGVQAYLKDRGLKLSETPALLSILYDIDLLPEQIMRPVNVGRMIAFCELFSRLTPEQVDSLFTKRE